MSTRLTFEESLNIEVNALDALKEDVSSFLRSIDRIILLETLNCFTPIEYDSPYLGKSLSLQICSFRLYVIEGS